MISAQIMLYLTEIDGDNTLGLGKNVVLAGDVNAGGLSSTYNWRTGGKNGSIDLGFCCLALGVRFALRAMAALPHAWDSANAGRKIKPLRPCTQNTGR